MDVVDGFPVVYSVRKGSPMEQFLLPMDHIMAINEVDVYNMCAAEVVTQLMVSRMDKQATPDYIATIGS
jgi:C-terminal processing protease CtpA/Prc